MDPRVKAAMEPFLGESFGNPSAIYAAGRRAKEAIAEAREIIARALGSRAEEVIFTGSGTESDNMAVLGIARAYARFCPEFIVGRKAELGGTRGHVITSAIEHHAVLNPVQHLQKEGFTTTVLPVDEYGRVTPVAVAGALTPETLLVSIMYANNEIGTIEPIAAIGKAIREWKKAQGRGVNDPPFFHTDACQAAGYLDVSVQNLGVDLLTVNGSKIYGPKGTGALYVRRGIKIEPLVFGGGQEQRLRSGTENVAGIVGFAEALRLVHEEREAECARLTPLRDKLIAGIIRDVPKVVLNGHPTERLPNNANLSLLDIEGEAVLLYLDEYGISAATGSACDSASLEPSHVILALGRPYEYAHASTRFTLGRKTSREDIDYVLETLPGIVQKLRSISPVHIEFGEKEACPPDRQARGMAKAFVDMGRPHWEKSIKHKTCPDTLT